MDVAAVVRALTGPESSHLTYTPPVRPAGVEIPHTIQPPTPEEHPTQELPALSFPPARQALLGSVANLAVTLLLVIAVAGVMLVNVGPLFLPYKVFTVLSGSMAPTIPVGRGGHPPAGQRRSDPRRRCDHLPASGQQGSGHPTAWSVP